MKRGRQQDTKNEAAGLKEVSGVGPHPGHCFEEVGRQRYCTRKEGRAERKAGQAGEKNVWSSEDEVQQQ